MKFIVVMILLFNVGSTYANFKCKAVESMQLSDTGVMDKESDVAKMHQGKEFTVNRSTGIITGGDFINNMSGQLPKVLDTYKPKDNSYKAITIYEPNLTVDYLEIKEYVAGNSKPFIFKAAWGSIVTGLCSYY